MRITELHITNFRSYGPETKPIKLTDFTAFVGANSSGKSALMIALLRMFGVKTKDRLLTRSDFYVSNNATREEKDRDKILTIEVKIEFPELYGGEGEKTIPSFFNYMVVEEQGKAPYLRIRLSGSWTKGNSIDGEIDQKLEYIKVPYGSNETDACIAVAAYERSLIQMIYVPAIREPAEQLKNASGTILYRLLGEIEWPNKFDDLLSEETEAIDKLFNEVNGFKLIKNEIADEWNKFHNDKRYNSAQIGFSIASIESILKRIEVQFSPTETTNHYSIERLSEGLRSLFYLSLVSSILNLERLVNKDNKAFKKKVPIALTILAIEEPENHISPHLLGKVMKNLKDISSNNNAQTILSSHNASIIKRIKPEEIRHIRVDDNGCSIVSCLKLPEKLVDEVKYVKEAIRSYPELYFSKLVILGEGDSEEIILDKLMEIEGLWSDATGISIAPLGGRYVNHFWKLLNELNIPHITLLDLDLGRTGGGWGRIKYALQQLLINLNSKEEKQKLLQLPDGKSYLSEDDLNHMHHKSNSLKDEMNFWLERLKEFDVYYSSPLDIDFLLLEAYFEKYKSLLKNNKVKNPEEEIELLQSGIAATLKKKKYSEGLGEDNYLQDQLNLMPAYKTLFLGRGKPVTHIEALTKLEDEEIIKGYPTVFKELLARIKEKLK
ncbi:hypothetical protein BKK39_26500 [Bacillus cereus]|uniref:ATP-dependent nuclease n=1 Tax=Bacillus cereus group TaxID=86661 RepID=UPI000976146C|nr:MULTISPECIES: AAA family ATPase [Bacillus cereus group]ASK15858.1 hypothetical protein BA201_18665 [Bacillus cereus]MCC2439244.1 AAA family ATPase [Bacillus paranthracis]MDG1605212.1 AAA family ATPase [Bacillus paranthracis]MDZ4433251.1 AAA family ATPase [Bacillus cereus]MDZ4510513.1 AAA family ATPase [Bacillus cereus]